MEREVMIVRAARTVRERIAELLGAEAGEVSERLDALLAERRPDVDAIVELLSGRDATRQAMRAELTAIQQEETRADYAAPAGLAAPAAPIVYNCLVCGFAYPVFEVGEPYPEACPNGHGRLIEAG
ncbi:hypothetical protein GCM10029978_070380 [Actinoallomurus acanthiterrae]